MNDLDRKIAELKGYEDAYLGKDSSDDFGGNPIVIGRRSSDPPGQYTHVGGPWAESDAKAFELVDELVALGFRIEIHQWERPKDMGPGPCCALRVFHPKIAGYDSRNQDVNRRWAICRAYIAAVTWMREKGK